ncbi:MAG: pyridoxal phosphate-dependent aminotransferase [Caldiserica bacterium]|nr:pyridoxal phosphate-dependent aminotransferase [Caldisericota bacterium]
MANPRYAKRMDVCGTETAFEMLAKARALEAQGKHVVHLEIGEPDFDTPAYIKNAAIKALNAGYTHYTPAAGIAQVRETVAEYVSKTRNIPVDPDEVVVTPGAKPIMSFVMLALVDEGDEVIYPNPGYPIYESMINFTGGTPVPIPLKEELDFRLDVEELAQKITPKTRLIVLNSPHNPTGGILSRKDLERLAELIEGKDIFVLSDEIYSRIIYDGEHISLASLPGMKEQVIILDGFSKTYAMTGWRLGYGVMKKELASKVTKLQVNFTSCSAAFVQMAGMEALKGPQDDVEKMVQEFRRRRDVIVHGLNGIPGVTCTLPKGAFYAFPNVKSFKRPAKEIADYLLNEAGVAVLSGTAFGTFGEGYLRLSYANSVENIQEALRRIKESLARFS